ncbi:MAG: FkbM family methyltransferase [Bacteroidota bacterium]
MKKLLKKIVKRTGYSVRKLQSQEALIFATQKKLLSTTEPVTIFDVGAYLGETVAAYHQLFAGHCSIYAFEPFPEVFAQLKTNTAAYANVHLFNCALGDAVQEAPFYVNKFHATNSLLATDPQGHESWGKGILETERQITVPIRTIDELVEDQQLKQIDILKLDTQGSEDLILAGARESINRGLIKIIRTEMIVMPTYQNQKPLHEILGLYTEMGFQLYNLYNVLDPKGQLRFLDGIFVHQSHMIR